MIFSHGIRYNEEEMADIVNTTENGSEKDISELNSLEGVVEHIIYSNETNGWCVCELSIHDEELVTAVGTMPFLSVGENIKCMGDWTVHPSFGRQFRVEYYEKQMPTSEDDILKYLSSRTVKGIGPVTAAKLVERFGEDTFDVLENHPEWLTDVPGITKKKADEMSEDFRHQFGARSVMMFCREFFGPATAVKVYNKWGSAAIDIIKENPYSLCDSINGIGFPRADNIAASLGIKPDSIYRIKAAIKYTLRFNADKNGHCFVPKKPLIHLIRQMIEVDKAKVTQALDILAAEGSIVSVKRGNRTDVYLREYYDAEMYSANKLDQLDRLCPGLDTTDIERFIQLIESESGIKYAPMQRRAIFSVLGNGVTILTGGPGTGKTTVIRAVLRVFDSLDFDVALAAPTGRAAKRMSEATSREARTIHRLLEMDFNEGEDPRFCRDEKNQLDEDVIIIDETSMVDIKLMASLLKAIKPGARLMLIGDADQLPSVGAGNVLRNIIASEHFTTVTLHEIFRQAGESMIVTNAHSINSGELPELDKKDGDFFFLDRASDHDIAVTVCNLYVNRLPKAYGESIRGGIQIITPSRKGEAGTAVLNNMLQSAINPPDKNKKEHRVAADFILREGDRVMQIKNNYDIEWNRDDVSGVGIFNGDIGTVCSIDTESCKAVISFDERIAEYDWQMLPELELAYAITVHKSQGSEYPVVIIPLYGFAPQLMTRNLLYTAITRAQQMVVLVGRRDIVQTMVENNSKVKRYSALAELLCALNDTSDISIPDSDQPEEDVTDDD